MTKILVDLPQEMIDALPTGKGREGGRAEYIRTALAAALASDKPTTHRASFAFGGNDFLSEDTNGNIYMTEVSRVIPFYDLGDKLAAAFIQHTETGSHPDCVICQDKQKRAFASGRVTDGGETIITPADPRSEAEREHDDAGLDLLDTQRNAR